MKVEIPAMVDDVHFARLGTKDATEGVRIEEDFFLDGPVTRRVAVVDLNEKTGQLEPGARFIPPSGGNILGKYAVPEVPVPTRDDFKHFIQVSVFATIYETIKQFEKPDTLGRKVTWGFDGPQLLVVPRAGTMENAFYERKSRSLQFFSFPDPKGNNNIIYTSLARDIVAHECGHAILDGIAPHLNDTMTPQAIALHEAIGDLTALLVSIDSDKLRPEVLKATHGSIQETTHFSAIAEEFGMSRGSGALRSLKNETTMRDIACADPHEVCTVLTGALFAMLAQLHERRKQAEMSKPENANKTEFSLSGLALVQAASQLRCMAFRALDLLPMGDISFADYGRAIIASDQAAHPDHYQDRDFLVAEFVKRYIVPDKSALEVEPPKEILSNVNLDVLVTSDWAAYDFANSHRKLLRIPEGMPFQVAPRREVDRTYYHHRGDTEPPKETVREILFKVSWHEDEPNNLGAWARRRRVAAGTTLCVDYNTKAVRAVVTCGPTAYPAEAGQQRKERDALLLHLAEHDLLATERRGCGADGQELRGAITATSYDGILRVKNTGNMLHIAREA